MRGSPWLLALALARTGSGDEAAAMLAALEAHYAQAQTVHLDFTQKYLSRATGRTIEESGTLVAAKPGRMRWRYKSPEKLFVLKDGVSWFYVPEENVVYRMSASDDEARRVPTLLLAGKTSLGADHTAAIEAGSPPATLRLVPRQGGEDYDYLLVQIDPKTAALRSLTVVDPLANVTTYEFRDERRDLPLPADAFDWVPPKDVEVVEAR